MNWSQWPDVQFKFSSFDYWLMQNSIKVSRTLAMCHDTKIIRQFNTWSSLLKSRSLDSNVNKYQRCPIQLAKPYYSCRNRLFCSTLLLFRVYWSPKTPDKQHPYEGSCSIQSFRYHDLCCRFYVHPIAL